jgi:hypothetical protein
MKSYASGLFGLIILTAFLGACNGIIQKDRSDNLPSAKGAAGEILLVMDSSLYAGDLGYELRQIFRAEMPGLPRDEARFKLLYIHPLRFNTVLQSAKNIIFVTVLDDNSLANRKLKGYFTKESIEAIEKDPNLYMLAKKDDFARGQEILHLFGKTEEVLIENIIKNRSKLQGHFDEIENRRMYQSLYSVRQRSGITSVIEQEFNASLLVPSAYEIAMQETEFIWLRHFTREVDRNIYVYYTDYTSPDQFSKESIINMRNDIAKKFLYGDPDNLNSFMITEVKNFEVATQEINFNGKFAIETRALWRTNNLSMGGPFISYTLVDEAARRLYYIEGFLYSPGKDQREFMRELEVILKTFKTSSEIQS